MCYAPLRAPVSCDTCSTLYCKVCLSDWVSSLAKRSVQPSCPICRAALDVEAASSEWQQTERRVRKPGASGGGGGGAGSGAGAGTAALMEEKDAQGRTALARAVARCNAAAVAQLLRLRADPRTTDAQRATPLHTACRAGADDIAIMLLEAGAIPDALDGKSHSPLDELGFFKREERMPRTLTALRSGAFRGNCEGRGAVATSLSRGFALEGAWQYDIRNVRPPKGGVVWLHDRFLRDRFCMEWPAPQSVCVPRLQSKRSPRRPARPRPARGPLIPYPPHPFHPLPPNTAAAASAASWCTTSA